MGPRTPTPDRRQVLGGAGAAASGIVSLALPVATAAASPPTPSGGGPSAPANVTATPIGTLGDGTGGIRLTWDAVVGATSYTVAWST